MLTVISFAGKDKNGICEWLCLCSCGGQKIAKRSHLRAGDAKSCGCLMLTRMFKHGFASRGKPIPPEYRAWLMMKQRCGNPNNKEYRNYGARGITVCQEWRSSFTEFFSDMGERPSKDHSIDRINVNGHYSKENCRWATRIEQQNNKRDNIFYLYRGRQVTLSEIARLTRINRSTLQSRLRSHKGLTIEAAINFIGKTRRVANAS